MTCGIAIAISIICCPFMGFWGLAVGPVLVATFAWAYYSMVGFVWLVEKITGRNL